MSEINNNMTYDKVLDVFYRVANSIAESDYKLKLVNEDEFKSYLKEWDSGLIKRFSDNKSDIRDIEWCKYIKAHLRQRINSYMRRKNVEARKVKNKSLEEEFGSDKCNWGMYN